MTDVHIPFAKSQSEAADPKLLPDGTFSAVRNMRIRRDGRLESRYGYATQAGAPAALSSVVRSFVYENELVSVIDRASATVPAYVIIESNPSSPTWQSHPQVSPNPDSSSTLGSVFAGVQRSTVVSGAVGVPTSTDSTTDAAGNIWTVVCAPTGAATSDAWVTQTAVDGTQLFSVKLTTADPLAVKIVRCGGTIVVVHSRLAARGTVIQAAIDVTSKAVAYSTVASGYTFCGLRFDVAPSSSTQYWLAFQDTLITVVLAQVAASTGVPTTVVTRGVTSGHDHYMSIAVHPTADAVLLTTVDATTRIASAGEWTKSGSVLVAWAAVDSSGYAWGHPVAGIGTGNSLVFGLNFRSGSGSNWAKLYDGGSQLVTAYTIYGQLVSRPGLIGTQMFAWIANSSSAAPSDVTTYYLVGTRAASGTGNVSATYEASACAHDAYQGTISAAVDLDPRRNITSLSSGDAVCLLPVFVSQAVHGADLIRIMVGDDVGQAVHINNQAILPGAIVREWSGANLVESGMLDGPKNVTCAVPGTGNVDVGQHQYVVVWEWRDERGRVHRSPPSVPVPVNITPLAGTVSVSFDGIPITSKLFNLDGTQLSVVGSVYRTLAGGGIFYFVGSTATLVYGTTFTDNLADATIAVNRVLYTQGARGALSGLLPNDPPPPARYAACSATRVILGGLEDPTAVQWSKLVYPGEPVQWSIDLAYRANVEGAVTGVAVLDGTWIVFTHDAIWEIVGDGPDDTGNGSFQEPRKRPSTTGCINHRSIVDTADGIMFQGTNGGIWLLPRGGNAPQWIGQPVRTTVTTDGEILSATRLDAENCVYWSYEPVDAIPSNLIVYDTRNGEWYVDSLGWTIGGIIVDWAGRLVMNGLYAQTPGSYVDAGPSVVVSSAITGDMRPFGPGGWGRMRLVHLLAEFGSACTIAASISYDSGKTWTDAYAWALTGPPGDTVDVQFGPSRVRGCDYRIKIVVTPAPAGKGLALNSMSLDLYKAERLRRVAAAQRG
jgi:hypothetical protein